ncbi:hypothetical protein NMY22_g14227 [Coprinellus aureogranulatus]|nr:hypothetical protein NMY22_g14227 [Coprinellus aureogranulatus]
MDQMGVLILMSKGRTYDKKGTRQVEVRYLDEKRAYTLCVTTTPNGDILGFQQTWSGQTKRSLPTKDAPGYNEALAQGTRFTVAQSQKKTSHFSTFSSMKQWMEEIFAPYVKQYIEDHNLEPDQKAILLIDCYPVHIGIEFQTYVFEKHPNVPGFSKPPTLDSIVSFKHHLRQEAVRYLVDSHTKQIEEGLTPEKIVMTSSLPALRDASIQPIVNLYEYLSGNNGRELIRMAWRKCSVKEWNLGTECLQSRAIRSAYRAYVNFDEILHKEISDKIGREALQAALPTEDPGEDEFGQNNPTDIPLDTIAVAGFADEAILEGLDCAADLLVVNADSVVHGDDGECETVAEEENIWAYTSDGRKVTDALSES